MSEETLSNLLHENRRFEPPAELAAAANVKAEAYAEADADREAFWAKAAERLSWDQKWDRVLDWDNPPFAKWFLGGRLNAAYNCVDRHVEAGNGDRVALHWVGEPVGDTRDITYAQLKDDVSRAANALTALGVEAGDRVAIYMPMIPEAITAMLACARLGAPHTVVFGGFSAEALASRIEDCGAKVVITADGGYRRGAPSPLKPAVDEAREIAKDEKQSSAMVQATMGKAKLFGLIIDKTRHSGAVALVQITAKDLDRLNEDELAALEQALPVLEKLGLVGGPSAAEAES